MPGRPRQISVYLICDISGIPIKSEKTVSPTTVLTIYGIEVDSDALVCRLPEAKLIKIRDYIT